MSARGHARPGFKVRPASPSARSRNPPPSHPPLPQPSASCQFSFYTLYPPWSVAREPFSLYHGPWTAPRPHAHPCPASLRTLPCSCSFFSYSSFRFDLFSVFFFPFTSPISQFLYLDLRGFLSIHLSLYCIHPSCCSLFLSHTSLYPPSSIVYVGSMSLVSRFPFPPPSTSLGPASCNVKHR